MSQRHAAASTRAARIIKARPEELYAAFMDPAALVAWLPPAEMTGQIHAFDARVGGGYRMSLFYPPTERSFRGKTSDREDRVNVRLLSSCLHAGSFRQSTSIPLIRPSSAR